MGVSGSAAGAPERAVRLRVPRAERGPALAARAADASGRQARGAAAGSTFRCRRSRSIRTPFWSTPRRSSKSRRPRAPRSAWGARTACRPINRACGTTSPPASPATFTSVNDQTSYLGGLGVLESTKQLGRSNLFVHGGFAAEYFHNQIPLSYTLGFSHLARIENGVVVNPFIFSFTYDGYWDGHFFGMDDSSYLDQVRILGGFALSAADGRRPPGARSEPAARR